MPKWHVVLGSADRKKIKMVLRSKKVLLETKKRAQILSDIETKQADGHPMVSA